MKLKFGLKNKIEASFEGDVEGIVKTSLEYKSDKPIKKSRYQIKQEEKRKNKELEQKQMIRYLIMMICFIVFILIICMIGSIIW